MTNRLKSKIQLSLWLSSILLVIIIGLFYFPKEHGEMDFWKTLYFTLRLFVFEHDLSTFPKSKPLIFIYFLAPLITVSAAGTAISYLFKLSPSIQTRRISEHVIVCGVGRTGKLFISALKNKGIKVVGVDLGPPEEFEEWQNKYRVPMLFGNFVSRLNLQKAGAHKSRSVIFASGDDLLNLEGAISAYEWLKTDEGPVRLIWAQITNDYLANTARAAIQTRGNWGIRFFDTYRIAAIELITNYFNREIRKGIKKVNILGFGKFGRDLMDVLVNDRGADEKFDIRVIDKQERESDLQALSKELNIEEKVSFEKATIQTLQLHGEPDHAFFLCTDDDIGNLTKAMSLTQYSNTKHIYVRMGRWPISAVADNVSEDRGIVFINIKELVVQGIEELPGIFEPANTSHLKRAKLMKSPSAYQ